ncbi:MAG: polysaccharide pyruvyl transferase family protein [Myxococcales bacterium]|jgi:polysaccharide pyruvyl transferase WcaK-like protein
MASVLRQLFDRATDPDRALMRAMAAAVDAAAVRHALDRSPSAYEPGRPLRLLLAGYSGTRNTGSDVRVEEMIRQFRTVLGDDQLELSVLTINPELSAGYFRTVRQVRLPALFPKFLYDECPRHHGVVACEGSMFKSKFANALTTMMSGSLGMAGAEGKLSVGYGGEAGEMVPHLQDFVRKQCRHSLVICRNEPSRDVLEALGVRTLGGTDTAWTFEPAPHERGRHILLEQGWDGRAPLLVVCPINPYHWPAQPDLLRAAALRTLGQFRDEHYEVVEGSPYFHSWSPERARDYGRYIDALAEGVGTHARERGAFVVVAGSEMVDRGACEDLAARLPDGAPVLVSDELDMYDFVSMLRCADVLISSRFHAIVTSMAGGVPAIGVTMDERIHNLLHDRGHADYLLRVDDDGLGEALLTRLRRMQDDAERVRAETLAYVPGQIRIMGQMGMAFVDEVQRVYPDFPARDVPRSFEHFIPPLSPRLQALMEQSP